MNATKETFYYSINDIERESLASGSHWFDHDTMRCFGTRCHSQIYNGENGIFFVTGDKTYNDGRAYTVRQWIPEECDVKTIGEFGQYKYRSTAHSTAKRLAGEAKIMSQVHNPISAADQLVLDMERNGIELKVEDATQLILLARTHHRGCEDWCNTGKETTKDWARQKIRKGIDKINAYQQYDEKMYLCPLFSGDPRGCTVRLVLPNGETNDFAKKGWVVPTEL